MRFITSKKGFQRKFITFPRTDSKAPTAHLHQETFINPRQVISQETVNSITNTPDWTPSCEEIQLLLKFQLTHAAPGEVSVAAAVSSGLSDAVGVHLANKQQCCHRVTICHEVVREQCTMDTHRGQMCFHGRKWIQVFSGLE